jgi:hypothetical protein
VSRGPWLLAALGTDVLLAMHCPADALRLLPRSIEIRCDDHFIGSVAGIARELKDEHARQVSVVHHSPIARSIA